MLEEAARRLEDWLLNDPTQFKLQVFRCCSSWVAEYNKCWADIGRGEISSVEKLMVGSLAGLMNLEDSHLVDAQGTQTAERVGIGGAQGGAVTDHFYWLLPLVSMLCTWGNSQLDPYACIIFVAVIVEDMPVDSCK